MPEKRNSLQKTEVQKMKNEKPAMRFTQAQEKAITSETEPLLVSAAAGSGKTAVLCERILRKLLREDNPAELSRMLIVTFTRAAAEELKNRLSEKMKDALLKDPGNKHLRRQIAALPKAKICTIHSFCFDLLRRNFHLLGLSASLRILDEREEDILSRRVMEECIDRFYGGEEREDFEKLTDCLVDTRDDTLSYSLVSVYRRLCSEPEGIGLISSYAGELRAFAEAEDGEFFSTSPGKVIRENIVYRLNYFLRLYDFVLERIKGTEPVEKAYGSAFASDREYITRLIGAADGGAQKLRELLLSPPKPKLSRLKKEYQDGEISYFKEIRTAFFKFIEDKKSLGLSFSSEELRKIFRSTADRLFTLAKIEKFFAEALEKEKKRLSVVDFNDVERLTAGLLSDEAGAPTPFAKELAERFDEVCVDEYQDVNATQDLIFRRIAPERRFMVGDVKQSIYGFRGARPEIFSEYRNRFLSPDEYAECVKDPSQEEKPGVKLFLSENFRCDSKIISFSNAIFGSLFSASRSIRYVPEDDLRHGKGGEDRLLPVELWICDESLTPSLTLAEEAEEEAPVNGGEADGNESEKGEENDEQDGTNGVTSEAALTAARVEALLREGRAPEEIAILVRSLKNCFDELAAAFSARGIELSAGTEQAFEQLPEILLLQSLLRAIDNPLRDVSLVSAMKSPLFDFTLSELAALREKHPAGHFYYALKAALPEKGDAEKEEEKDLLPASLTEKCARFHEFLEKYRRLNAAVSPDRLILQLLTEYSLLPMLSAGLDGEETKKCRLAVMKYYDLARSYAERGRSGLSGFLFQMEKRGQSKGREKQTAGAVPGKVRLMTVHNAKGLEFPVCILYGCGKSFSGQKGDFLFDATLGPAITLQDESGYGKIFTPQMTAVKLRAEAADTEEEMRILYVALTRAREQLIITGSCKDAEKLRYSMKLEGETLSPATFDSARNRNYLHWLLLCLSDPDKEKLCEIYQSKDAAALQKRLSAEDSERLCKSETSTEKASTENTAGGKNDALSLPVSEPEPVPPLPAEQAHADERTDDRLSEELAERLSFRYPYREEARLPAKLSVSRLWPDILDGDAEGGKDLLRSATAFTHPSFIEGENRAAGAAERGSATHTFMQFCSFENVAERGVREELLRLEENKFLSPRVASLVDCKALSVFFASDVFRKMQSAPLLRREQRFNILLPASWFTTEQEKKATLAEERLLVQGVIDCFFETEEGKLWLLDYKTDHFPRAASEKEIAEAEKTLILRHRRQITYYRAALEKICRRQVDVTALWSFSLGRAVILREEDSLLPPDMTGAPSV